MHDLRVQPDRLTGAAPVFSGVAHEVETALDRLRSTLAGLGAFWGDDEQGAQFASGYEPQAATVQKAADNIARGLTSIRVALEAQAANYTETDSALSRHFGG